MFKSFTKKIIKIVGFGFSDRFLLFTNVGLSVFLSSLGDVIQQRYEILSNKMETWDRVRTRNMGLSGMGVGIFCHYWYNYLDRKLPGYSIRTVLTKIMYDQLVCSPVCITTLFVTTGFMEEKTSIEILEEMRRKAWILYAAEWTIWPPAQFINFYFLPTKYRVLYDNTISLGYDVYTSYIKHRN